MAKLEKVLGGFPGGGPVVHADPRDVDPVAGQFSGPGLVDDDQR